MCGVCFCFFKTVTRATAAQMYKLSVLVPGGKGSHLPLETSWARHHHAVPVKEVSSQDLWLNLSIPVLKIQSPRLSKGWLDCYREEGKEKKGKKEKCDTVRFCRKSQKKISFYERKPAASEEVARRRSWSETSVLLKDAQKEKKKKRKTLDPFHVQRRLPSIQRQTSAVLKQGDGLCGFTRGRRRWACWCCC